MSMDPTGGVANKRQSQSSMAVASSKAKRLRLSSRFVCILFFTDNEALVYIINQQSCKRLMSFVHQLVLIYLSSNIVFKAKHVPTSHNGLADALFRLQVQTFQRLEPSSVDKLLTDIPLHLPPQN